MNSNFFQDTYVDRRPGESANDRNDRSIRVAAEWYSKHVTNSIDVVMLSNDAENRRLADEMSIKNASFEAYISAMSGKPHLVNIKIWLF